MHCPVCKSAEVKKYIKRVEDFYFESGAEGDLWLCECGSLLNFEEDMKSLEYESYYTGKFTVFEPREIKGYFSKVGVLRELNFFSKNYFDCLGDASKLKVLDYGSGSGAFGLWMAEQGAEVHLYDEYQNPHSEVTGNHGVRTVVVHDNISTINEKFDVVYLNHVIEHVVDPVALITWCEGKLKKEGCIVIFTPNANSLSVKLFGRFWRGLEYPRHKCILSLGAVRFLQVPSMVVQKCQTICRSSRDMGFYSSMYALLPGWSRKRKLVRKILMLCGYLYQVFQFYLNRVNPGVGEELFVVIRKR